MKHFFVQHQLVFVDTRLLFVQRQTFCFNTKLFFEQHQVFVFVHRLECYVMVIYFHCHVATKIYYVLKNIIFEKLHVYHI